MIFLRKTNANPEKSGRPVDSHEEWARIHADSRLVVQECIHLDLAPPSSPLVRSETLTNDPVDAPRQWRRRCACRASSAALRRRPLDRKASYFHLDFEGRVSTQGPVENRFGHPISRLWTVTRIRPPFETGGTRMCTFGPTVCVIASHTLRNEGERPTVHPEALEAAVLVPSVASRAPAPLLEAKHDLADLKFSHSALGSAG